MGGLITGARYLRFSNCSAVAVASGSGKLYSIAAVSSSDSQGGTGLNVAATLRAYGYDIQGSAGDHKQLFCVSQSGSSIMPRSQAIAANFTGSPDSGKTNTQNYADNGELCIFGEISPGGVTTHASMDTDVRVSAVSAYSAPAADAVLAVFGEKLCLSMRADSGVYAPATLGHSRFGKNVPTNGLSVGYWQGRDWRDTGMTMATAEPGGTPPFKYVTSGLNGKPVVEFNGLGTPPSQIDAGVRRDWTFLVLCRPDQAGGLYQFDDHSFSGMAIFDAGTKATLFYRYRPGSQLESNASSKDFGSWVMLLARKSGTTLQFWEHTGGSNVSLGSVTASWVESYSAFKHPFKVGLDIDQGAAFSNFKGRMAQMCFLNRALSDSDAELLADTVASDWSYTG